MVSLLLASSTNNQPVLSSNLTLRDWLTALAVLVLSLALGRVLRAFLERRVEDPSSAHSAVVVLGRFTQLLVGLAGLIYALVALGVRIGPLLGAIGIGGIALALAAQSILTNLIASFLLQVRRPFRRGDQIATNDIEGTVEDVNFRVVVLRTYDGERTHIPAAKVLDAAITNYTAYGRRRTTLQIGVAYRTDLALAQEVMLAATRDVDGVLPAPAAEAWVEQFGESSIDFALRFWHKPDIATMWRVRSAVAMAIKRAFDRHDIEIPFPQRVLTVGAGETLRVEGALPAAPSSSGAAAALSRERTTASEQVGDYPAGAEIATPPPEHGARAGETSSGVGQRGR